MGLCGARIHYLIRYSSSTSAAAAGAFDPIIGPAGIKAVRRLPGSQRLGLAITLRLRNQEELVTLLHDLYDPTSPNDRHFLTVEEFTERFGPTEEDYEAVANFARSNGLAVTHTAANRLVLDVNGAVSDIERAFGVTMQVYQHPTEKRTFYAPDVEPSLDPSIPVQGVQGLDSSPPQPADLKFLPLVEGTPPEYNRVGTKRFVPRERFPGHPPRGAAVRRTP